MHTFGETGAGVPAFLAKLWRLVEDPETNNLICWSKDGRSFIIQNQAQFARELLPLNYKHNNMASFIRQLNMYGFHKITSIDNGGLKFDRDEMEFTHPCFKRNCPYLLEHIKRKIASTKSVDDKSAMKPEAVNKVLQDVKAMRGRQDSLDSRFSVMKQENEALWREIASLRQKHAKQQQIVNKLIQFLITIVQPQRNMTGVKRHMQLMINDTPDKMKLRKASESESDCGPVIHELGEELLDEVSEVEPDLMTSGSPFRQNSTTPTTTEPDAAASPQHIERPHSSVSLLSQNYDYSNQSGDDASLGYISPSLNNSSSSNQKELVQAVNTTDGSNIFYHITEVPDAHPQEPPAPPINYNDDNVLTTPMVRAEEMARTQMLRQKNRQRRKEMVASPDSMSSGSPKGNNNNNSDVTKPKQQRLQQRPQQQQQQQQQQQMLSQAQELPQPLQIKSEDEPLDPLIFLNVYPDSSGGMTPDPNLISPNLSEESRQSSATNGAGNYMLKSPSLSQGAAGNNSNSGARVSPTENNLLTAGTTTTNTNNDLYNPSNFITNDMPAEIFEDNTLMSAGDNSNFDDNFKLNLQEQFGRSTVNSGKFSSYMAGNGNGGVGTLATGGSAGPSTSAASVGLLTNNTNNNNNGNGNNSDTKPSTSKSSNGNMTLTKYNSSGKLPSNEDIMRSEVSGHLEIMQDELESLKDLLRSDVYSLDHNTLLGSLKGCNTGTPATAGMTATKPFTKLNIFENNNNNIFLPPTMEAELLQKLFNDSEILGMGAYGLHLPKDTTNDRNGSELMAYQPMYDLSDIINEQSDLDADNNSMMRPQITQEPDSSTKQNDVQPSSGLNTPYHE
ncbi:heat shock factor protein isoform X2 [Musca domestica]|uniref:Heat shock factor protein isoform X2 n=1 Tax=Musca domestica TaxID=7370 RepID=A0A1I8MR34_MUSDO|nr:heat shock factor protein isoform X2 [Musca domestica]